MTTWSQLFSYLLKGKHQTDLQVLIHWVQEITRFQGFKTAFIWTLLQACHGCSTVATSTRENYSWGWQRVSSGSKRFVSQTQVTKMLSVLGLGGPTRVVWIEDPNLNESPNSDSNLNMGSDGDLKEYPNTYIIIHIYNRWWRHQAFRVFTYETMDVNGTPITQLSEGFDPKKPRYGTVLFT